MGCIWEVNEFEGETFYMPECCISSNLEAVWKMPEDNICPYCGLQIKTETPDE